MADEHDNPPPVTRAAQTEYYREAADTMKDRRVMWMVGIVLVFGLLLYFLGPILTPFLLAAILAYVCDPLVDRMQRWHIPRALGVLLTMIFLGAVLAALVIIIAPLFTKQAADFLAHLPDYIESLRGFLEPKLQAVGINFHLTGEDVRRMIAENWGSAGGAMDRVLPSLKTGGLRIFEFAFNAVLVPIVLFYLLRDWDQLMAKIQSAIPLRWQPKSHEIGSEIDDVLGGFLRGQLTVMLLLTFYYMIALYFVGLKLAVPIAVVAGLLSFIPYLGFITGFVLATFAALTQFQSLGGLIPVWIVFGVGQVLEGMVFTPWLVGDKIGVHPVAVIFLILAFGQLFGFFGVLLALPLSAILQVASRHLYARYRVSSLYQN